MTNNHDNVHNVYQPHLTLGVHAQMRFFNYTFQGGELVKLKALTCLRKCSML